MKHIDKNFHTEEHKNITRAKFAQSFNPDVAKKMRAILNELKSKGACRG